MRHSEIINTLMFDWESYSSDEINELIQLLPNKLLRWLGENHPDNKTRKLFFSSSNISVSESAVINKYFIVSDDYEPLLTIEDRVAISPNVTVICSSAPNNSKLANLAYVSSRLIDSQPVLLREDAWVGANSIILPGVIIGKGCVIGAGSVVTKNTEPFSVFAGNPAKKLKNIPQN